MFKTKERMSFERISDIRIADDVLVFKIGHATFELYQNTNELYTNYLHAKSKENTVIENIMKPRKVTMGRTDDHGGEYLMCSVAGVLTRFHRLIGYLIYGSEIFGKEIDHIDGNRENHKLQNIRICNRDQNAKNASKRGAFLGKNLFKGKIKKEELLDILNRIETGETNKKISSFYGIDPSNISRIRHGKWKGVDHV